jgi:hypothetical protein
MPEKARKHSPRNDRQNGPGVDAEAIVASAGARVYGGAVEQNFGAEMVRVLGERVGVADGEGGGCC